MRRNARHPDERLEPEGDAPVPAPGHKKKTAAELIAAPDENEARARRDLADTLPKDFSGDDENLKQIAGAHLATSDQKEQTLYELLGPLYDWFGYLSANPEEQERFVDKCIREKILTRAKTDLSLLIVKYYLPRSSERRSRYATSLRGAALQHIPAGQLTAMLKKGVVSIKGLGKEFRARTGQQKGATAKTISLRGSDDNMRQWEDAKEGEYHWLLVRREKDGSGRVSTVSRSATYKLYSETTSVGANRHALADGSSPHLGRASPRHLLRLQAHTRYPRTR